MSRSSLGLTHQECGGRVYFDWLYKGDSFIDIACMMCGKRWFVPNDNPLARLITDGK